MALYKALNKLGLRETILLLTFLSGFSALCYQIVWQRVLSQEIGVDTVSVALIVTIFMIGLAFGSVFGGRLSLVSSLLLPKLYAFVELIVGLFGAFSIIALRGINQHLVVGEASITSTFLWNLSFLFVPTFLMGASTPLIIAIVRSRKIGVGTTIGNFYGANILGAALGALAAGLFLIEMFTLTGVIAIAAFLNFLIFAVIFCLEKPLAQFISDNDSADVNSPKPQGLFESFRSTFFLKIAIASVIFGFITLSYEMIAFRLVAMHYSLLSYIFPTVLAIFLLFMALGEVLGGRIIDRFTGDKRCFVFAVFPLCAAFTLAIPFLLPLQDFAIPPVRLLQKGNLIFVAGSIIILAPVIVLSTFFPALTKMSTRSVERLGFNVGIILFLFTIGNALGAFITPLILFHKIGAIQSIYIMLFLLLGGGLLVVSAMSPARKAFITYAACAALSVFIIRFIPLDYLYQLPSSKEQKLPALVSEDRTAVVSVFPTLNGYRVQAFRSPTATTVSDVTLMPRGVEYWNFSSLFAVNPDFRPKNVLVLGLGPAYWLYGLLQFDFVESLTVIELSPGVLQGVKDYSSPEIREIFRDDRVSIEIMDARRYVQSLPSDKKFDLIQVGIFHPWMSSASNLYTVEFMKQLKKHLTGDGFLAMPRFDNLIPTAMSVFNVSST